MVLIIGFTRIKEANEEIEIIQDFRVHVSYFDQKLEAMTLVQTFLFFSPIACIITKITSEKASNLKDFFLVILPIK